MSKPLSEILGDLAKDHLMVKKAFTESTSHHINFKEQLSKIPSLVERNDYKSAGMLIKKLDERYQEWNKQYPDTNYQLSILALVKDFIIRVRTITEESFHGIAIEGIVENSDKEIECLVIEHQSTLQLLCVAEKITKKNPRKDIGFIYYNATKQ